MTDAAATGRWLGAFGAIACAVSVALGAYASHAADGQAQQRLGLAALFAFGHGLALQCLSRRTAKPGPRLALLAMAVGLCLFSGSLAAAVFTGSPTSLAPVGGLLLIGAWVMLAIGALRE